MTSTRNVPTDEFLSQIYYDGVLYDAHWMQTHFDGMIRIKIISIIPFYSNVHELYPILLRRSKQILSAKKTQQHGTEKKSNPRTF